MVRVVRLSVGLLPCNGTDNAVVVVAGADTGSNGSRKEEEDSLAVVECGSVLFRPGIVVPVFLLIRRWKGLLHRATYCFSSSLFCPICLSLIVNSACS